MHLKEANLADEIKYYATFHIGLHGYQSIFSFYIIKNDQPRDEPIAFLLVGNNGEVNLLNLKLIFEGNKFRGFFRLLHNFCRNLISRIPK